MSDCSDSTFGFLSNWKLGLAVCVPCFAVGLGVTYYYYSKKPRGNQTRSEAPQCGNEKVHVTNVDNKNVKKTSETNGIDQNVVEKVCR